MPKLRATFTFEYEAHPELYYEEVPEKITKEVLEDMAEIDRGNIIDIIVSGIYDDLGEMRIEPVWDE